MSTADIRHSVKKITPKFAIIVVAIFLAMGLVQQTKDMTFAEVLPVDLASVAYCSVETDSETDAAQYMQITAEEGAALIELLDQLEFRTNGTANSLRFCYCRVFFVTDDGERAEVMLTDDMALVSHTTSEESAKVYIIKPNTKAIQAYIDELFA